MEKEHNIAKFFFGVFYLREQLHTYLDVFLKHQHKISNHLGYDNVILMVEKKKDMLRRADTVCWKIKHASIIDNALFAPIKNPWLVERNIQSCTDKKEMVQLLLEADQSLVKWCKWFLSEEPGNTEANKLFGEIIAMTDTQSGY